MRICMTGFVCELKGRCVDNLNPMLICCVCITLLCVAPHKFSQPPTAISIPHTRTGFERKSSRHATRKCGAQGQKRANIHRENTTRCFGLDPHMVNGGGMCV